MRPYRYRFHSRWLLPAEPRRVYAVLARPQEYPRWWPQVRAARAAPDGRSGSARVRSVLPYDLRVSIRELPGPSREPSPGGVGVLWVAVDGDIRGELGWRLRPWGAGTLAEFEQRVEVVTPPAAAPVAARPARAAAQPLAHDARRGTRAAEPARRSGRRPARTSRNGL
ncbi:LOW QUALITY PROTEIN: polyketide cyclase/dehydrase superfamily protein, partial [Streptomyces sp. SPB074]